MESVGSIEIMDPKMDSGCLAPGETLEEEYDVTKPLSPEEALGIIDQLLCHEMAWHLGYPLSQTLFTNVYIEAMLMPLPQTIKEAHFIRDGQGAADYNVMDKNPVSSILRAYILGLLKSCHFVNERIKAEHYYEEEDFVTNTYHRSLLDHFDLEDIRDALTNASLLTYKRRDLIPQDIAEALGYRLELREEFLRAIELAAETGQQPATLQAPWEHMEMLWEAINKSHALGKSVPESFSTKIQRKLTSTMPPRPIVHLSFEDANSHFKRLIVDGRELIKVLDFKDTQSLLNFVLFFQAKKPQPLVYIRTLLQSYLFKDMIILGSFSIRHLVDNDLALVAMPNSRLLDPLNDEIELPSDPRFIMANQMELFRQRAAQSYLDIFRAVCQNRCRIRRTLCHSIQDWETVQVDAEEVDVALAPYAQEPPIPWPRRDSAPAQRLPLSSWAYLYKLRLMEWIVQLGFELDIYAPDELAGMYWYLGHLARTRAQHIERIKHFTIQIVADLEKRNVRVSPEEQEKYDASICYLHMSLLEATVTRELADALSCLYTALLRLKLIVPPPRPYSTDQLRYDIRMKPFSPIGLPELPSHEVFTRAVEQADDPTSKILDTADEAVANAKKIFEILKKQDTKAVFTHGAHDRWVASTANGQRSAIATGLAVMVLRKAIKDAPDRAQLSLKVEFKGPDKRYHESWNVPSLVKK
ncbi:Mak10 subunit, NatC N-terminal acetyltransferase-domain-containing protein [Coniochaeta sp. 2T2.1]|nr:Mak10 subunit, NatC N-terminal acetyltransferase-domain-containing protein [Coniochaeta sp. 2T2.1]